MDLFPDLDVQMVCPADYYRAVGHLRSYTLAILLRMAEPYCTQPRSPVRRIHFHLAQNVQRIPQRFNLLHVSWARLVEPSCPELLRGTWIGGSRAFGELIQ